MYQSETYDDHLFTNGDVNIAELSCACDFQEKTGHWLGWQHDIWSVRLDWWGQVITPNMGNNQHWDKECCQCSTSLIHPIVAKYWYWPQQLRCWRLGILDDMAHPTPSCWVSQWTLLPTFIRVSRNSENLHWIQYYKGGTCKFIWKDLGLGAVLWGVSDIPVRHTRVVLVYTFSMSQGNSQQWLLQCMIWTTYQRIFSTVDHLQHFGSL